MVMASRGGEREDTVVALHFWTRRREERRCKWVMVMVSRGGEREDIVGKVQW
jgi:hypothetical protein